jgi:hypothetical protein
MLTSATASRQRRWVVAKASLFGRAARWKIDAVETVTVPSGATHVFFTR